MKLTRQSRGLLFSCLLRDESQEDLFKSVALQHSDGCVAKWLVSAVLQCPGLQWWVTFEQT